MTAKFITLRFEGKGSHSPLPNFFGVDNLFIAQSSHLRCIRNISGGIKYYIGPEAMRRKFTGYDALNMKLRLALASEISHKGEIVFMNRTEDQESYFSYEGQIKTGFLEARGEIPFVIQPLAEGIDLALWAKANRAPIEAALLRHGAILFRGFRVTSLSAFEEFARVTSSGLMDYSEPSTTRKELSSRIYTTTEYPATETIPLHNEMSYSHTWPLKIWFHCVTPAERGGETPIGDSRRVFDLLDPRIKEQFMRKKVLYIRSFGEGIGLPWQEVFGVSNKDEMEEICRKTRVKVEWKDGQRLRTRQGRQAVATHPRTGEMVWFNQAHIHHILNLNPALREALLSMVESKEFPLDINAFYGDGAPIEASVLEAIHEAYDKVKVSFPWQKGDVMMLDNMLIAHGRASFSGDRKVAVTMGEQFFADDLVSAERFE